MLTNATLSALMNLLILAGVPFLGYFLYHKIRHKRGFGEVARRAGLQMGEVKYIGYSVLATLLIIAALLIWPPPVESFTREGSAQHNFNGLGLTGQAIIMALLYGIIKTGFAEELLFRGLIAGSIGRRLSLLWANVVQAIIFLLPHLLILLVMPEMWGLLIFVFVTALFKGWLRIKSGSIVGPWILHGVINVVVCLSVAARTAS